MPLLTKIKGNIEDLKRFKGRGQDAELKRVVGLVENDIYSTIIATFFQTMMNYLNNIDNVPTGLIDFLDKWHRRANSPKNISNTAKGDYILFQHNLKKYKLKSLDLKVVLVKIENTLKIKECENLLRMIKEKYGIENFEVDVNIK